jgi:hypothetical protein
LEWRWKIEMEIYNRNGGYRWRMEIEEEDWDSD